MPRMLLTPATHPLAVFWAVKVITIGGLGQPAALTGDMAAPLTGGLGTEPLASPVPMVRPVERATTLTLTASLASHGGDDARRRANAEALREPSPQPI